MRPAPPAPRAAGGPPAQSADAGASAIPSAPPSPPAAAARGVELGGVLRARVPDRPLGPDRPDRPERERCLCEPAGLPLACDPAAPPPPPSRARSAPRSSVVAPLRGGVGRAPAAGPALPGGEASPPAPAPRAPAACGEGIDVGSAASAGEGEAGLRLPERDLRTALEADGDVAPAAFGRAPGAGGEHDRGRLAPAPAAAEPPALAAPAFPPPPAGAPARALPLRSRPSVKREPILPICTMAPTCARGGGRGEQGRRGKARE